MTNTPATGSTVDGALKACPFCGDPDPEEAESAVPNIHGGKKRAVYCNGCFCEGPTANTASVAIAAWNRRYSLPSSEGAGWIDLPALPEAQMPVLLDIGKKYPIRAMWVEAKTLPAGGYAPEDFGEYDEASDEYFCPAGWYEWNEHEETHWLVSATPLRWIRLPGTAAAAPEGFPECSGDPASCPENEGFGCCKPNPEDRGPCSTCHGAGRVDEANLVHVREHQKGPGHELLSVHCEACDGTGEAAPSPVVEPGAQAGREAHHGSA